MLPIQAIDSSLTRANEILLSIDSDFDFIQIDRVRQDLDELTKITEVVEKIARDLKSKQQAALRSSSKRIDEFHRMLSAFHGRSNIDDTVDNSMVVTSSIPKSIPNTKPLAPNISLSNVNIVPTLDDVPNVNIYWVEETNEFAIRIENILLRGHVGEIFTSGITPHKNKVNIVKCVRMNECPQLRSGTCGYYHDPKDIVDAHLDINSFQLSPRNYSNGNWVYNPTGKGSGNPRTFGSRSTLSTDIANASDKDKDMWFAQTMHSLLVTIATSQIKSSHVSRKWYMRRIEDSILARGHSRHSSMTTFSHPPGMGILDRTRHDSKESPEYSPLSRSYPGSVHSTPPSVRPRSRSHGRTNPWGLEKPPIKDKPGTY
jgi:hypothetical protein